MLQVPGQVREAVDSDAAKQAEAEAHVAAARSHFAHYRMLMNPRLKLAKYWFPKRLAIELRQFYEDWHRGQRPVLMISTPPQHGKSLAVLDFAAWVAGHDPDARIIYSSFSDRLSTRANMRMQRSLDDQFYKLLFPGTRLAPRGSGLAQRNFDILEFMGHDGYFRNTTVMGSITGESLDLGIIDDPVKGSAAAASPPLRDKAWDWLTNDVFSRFSESAALLLIGTRWHVDDPAGRLLEHYGQRLRVVRFPAIAEHDEAHRKQGEALFPQLKSLEFLNDRRKLYTRAAWEALYQQSPIVVGGGMFPIDKIGVVPFWDYRNIKRSVRYVDKAGTAGGDGSYTAMVLMHQMEDGRFVVEHVERGHWSALEREQKLKALAERDRALLHGSYEIGVEQEPGSGGKESAESTIRNLAGFNVYADRVTGAKEVRAEPFAAQVQGGNVYMLAGSWCRDFLDELEYFPTGKYKDQVDAASGAFARLTGGSQYSLDGPWLEGY